MVSAKKSVVITGNWKMHKTIQEAIPFTDGLLPHLTKENVKTGLAVPFTMIFPLAQRLKGKPLTIGAQNMNDATEGAFTGEVAAKMLKDAGATFVIVGHSERRRFYNEDNDFINRKVKRAFASGIQPILCVGENLAEHDAGNTHEIVGKQLSECLKDVTPEQANNLIIAYEPVWAIGSNNSAAPDEAQDMHRFCREVLIKLYSVDIANAIVIQYGGSVTPANAQDFLKQPDIDGLLVGGASLSLESFSKIIDDISH